MKDTTIFENIDTGLKAKFKAFHQSHLDVWEQFKAKAFELKAVRDRGSHWSIIGAIRWQNDLNVTNEPFKISNDYAALYARLMIFNYPEFEGFFELRKMKESDRRDSSEERYRQQICNKL